MQPSTPATSRARELVLIVHRYVGLVLTTFLIVAGTTGSMMAFYPELDAVVNPELRVARPPTPNATPLGPFEIRERLLAQLPESKRKELHGVLLEVDPERTMNYWVDGRETFVDPYSGVIVGSRKFGDLREGRKNLLTFLYELHFTLGLGEVGMFVFGLIAVLWTFDCFFGAYLTFPPGNPRTRAGERRRPLVAWLTRWLPSWLLKTNKLFSLVFTWHRASGLWVWLFLLVFAWSAVALNLGDVYEPVTTSLLGPMGDDPRDDLPHLEPPRETPKLSLREAHLAAQRALTLEAGRRGFEIHRELWLHYDPEHGSYTYSTDTSLDISRRLADTSLVIDGDTGALLVFVEPGGTTLASRVTAWLIALHFGSVRVGGMPYRIFVVLLGIAVTLLSVTGVWIWWKKRRARRSNRSRRRERRLKGAPPPARKRALDI